MGLALFVFGSATGAALAWFVDHREPSRSTVVTFSGIACGLLGALTYASRFTTAPAIEAGFGLLGTAAPLTLCMTPLRAVSCRGEILPAVCRVAAMLALTLVYGISCATLGFVSVHSARHVFGMQHISGKQNTGKPVDCVIMMSLKPSHASKPGFRPYS